MGFKKCNVKLSFWNDMIFKTFYSIAFVQLQSIDQKLLKRNVQRCVFYSWFDHFVFYSWYDHYFFFTTVEHLLFCSPFLKSINFLKLKFFRKCRIFWNATFCSVEICIPKYQQYYCNWDILNYYTLSNLKYVANPWVV